MNDELQLMIVQCQLHKGSECKKIDGRWYEAEYSLGMDTVFVNDCFLETITEYKVQLQIDARYIQSTANKSTWLEFAAQLKTEFGSERN